MDFADVIALGFQVAELGIEREVGQTDDRIHRRADFVAHVRQEHGFHLRGFLGFGFGLTQFFRDLLLVGDIHQQADRPRPDCYPSESLKPSRNEV